MQIIDFVKKELGGDPSGHDVSHALRVLSFARAIQAKEGGQLSYIEGCALLHDCLDSKLGLDNEKQEGRVYRCLLENGYSDKMAKEMIHTMNRMSFHLHDETDLRLEDKVVRDADRLDALGKIGAERALAYGKSHGRPLFSNDDIEQIARGLRPSGESTIAHFFDKLLILDNYLYTDTAKAMAVPLKEELVECFRELYRQNGLVLDEALLK